MTEVALCPTLDVRIPRVKGMEKRKLSEKEFDKIAKFYVCLLRTSTSCAQRISKEEVLTFTVLNQLGSA